MSTGSRTTHPDADATVGVVFRKTCASCGATWIEDTLWCSVCKKTTPRVASCKAPFPCTSQRVFRAADGAVGFRFEFCCRDHSPTPYLEVEMTPQGAARFARDILAAAGDGDAESP